MFKSYRLGFDIWGLLLFVVVMLPTVIWFTAPAPNDVLRTASETPVLDAVASLFQALTIGSLCFIINGERGRLRRSCYLPQTGRILLQLFLPPVSPCVT